MTQMNVKTGLDDCAKYVVSSTDIVVDGVPLGFGRTHRIRGRTLLSKVNDGVGLLILKQLEEDVIFLLNVDVVEGDILTADLLPG